MQHQNKVHIGTSQDLIYYVLAGFPEAVKEAVIYGEWNIESSEIDQYNNVRVGDILLLYCLEPINGIVGFATVKNKVEINGLPTIEFSRNYCLPSLLWKEEKISFDSINGINKGINLLDNREEIIRISSILSPKWGAELKNDINIGILEEGPFFSKNKCLECGKQLESRLAKYCADCKEKVKIRQSTEWNKKNIDKIKEAGRKWRLNNPDKLKEYRRRWKEANKDKIREQRKSWKALHPEKMKTYLKRWRKKTKKSRNSYESEQQDLFPHREMSDWCKKLRKKDSHLNWMARQKKRRKKIADIENRFGCYWEDKFKEVYEKHKHEDGAKILSLDYHTLFIWAKHLKIQRTCIYCHKKLATIEGTFHPRCKIRYDSEQQISGIKKLFSLIGSPINIDVLNQRDESIRQVIRDVVSKFPKRESIVIENRYLYINRKQTLEELCTVLGVTTRERVRQIEEKALRRLSHPSLQKTVQKKLGNLIFKDNEITDVPLNVKINELQSELNQLKQKLTSSTPQEIDNVPLTEIKLSVRAYNCLKDANIRTVGQLANRTESEMLSIRNFGRKTLWELIEILHSFGLRFNGEPAIAPYQENKNIPIAGKKKCLFVGCNVTPHEGKYCSKHKTAWQRRKSLMVRET